MAEIRITNLTFRYPGDQSFAMTIPGLHIESGLCTAIVGPSGSGKTTLLNLVAGTLLPDTGEIHVGETCINLLGEVGRRSFRSQAIGQVFQAFELLGYLNVIENTLLGSIIGSTVDTRARQRALALLESVGLANKTLVKPGRLSHGERQRVAVCRAMLNRPSVLLADEPTGNLDQLNKQNVVDLLIEQARGQASTLLMVTHDRSLLAAFDRVIDFEELTGMST